MENNYYSLEQQESKGNVIGGMIGAFIGAAIGAVIWAVVGMMGYIASIIGFVIAFLADKGYDLLKGRQGVIKTIVLIVCVILAVGAGTVGTYVWTAHNVYQEELAALSDFELKFYDIATEQEFIRDIFADSDVQGDIVKDSALGLVFGILGSFGLISSARKGKNQTPPANAADAQGDAFDESANDANSF